MHLIPFIEKTIRQLFIPTAIYLFRKTRLDSPVAVHSDTTVMQGYHYYVASYR